MCGLFLYPARDVALKVGMDHLGGDDSLDTARALERNQAVCGNRITQSSDSMKAYF